MRQGNDERNERKVREGKRGRGGWMNEGEVRTKFGREGERKGERVEERWMDGWKERGGI